jgi:hypothetical protein
MRYRKMAKMMMGQIDHARTRVFTIKAELLGDPPDRPKEFVTADLVEGLRDGTVKFTGAQLQRFAQEWAAQYTKDRMRYNRTTFEQVVLNNAFSKERAAEKKRYDAENALYQSRKERVLAEATKVEDAIVLGDQHAALQALTDFANFKL